MMSLFPSRWFQLKTGHPLPWAARPAIYARNKSTNSASYGMLRNAARELDRLLAAISCRMAYASLTPLVAYVSPIVATASWTGTTYRDQALRQGGEPFYV
jgi:hypothetical protein